MGHARCQRHGSVVRAALLLLPLLFAAALPAVHSQQQQWRVVPGQPLADATAQWGASNAGMAYPLPAQTVLDLRSTIFRRANDSQAVGGKAYARGTLSISGAPFDIMSANATPSSVIDTAQRAGLTPFLVTAALVLSDVSLFNMCMDDDAVGPFRAPTSSLIGIFPISPVVQQVFMYHTVLYMHRLDLLDVAYAVMVASAPWDAVSARYGVQADGMSTMVQLLQWSIGTHDVYAWQKTLLKESFPGVTMVLRDVNKPNDPLMTFMRAQGKVMPARWCKNGTLVPSEIADTYVDLIWGPMWMEGTEAGVLAGLVNATALAPVQQEAQLQLPIPAVMVFTPTLALPEASLPGTGQLNLNASLILCGALNATSTPVLDLTPRSTALFNLTGVAQLFVGWLALRVPAFPLPLNGSSSHGLVSALPLAILAQGSAPTTGATAPLQLYNTTLVLPALDFLALITLATDSSRGVDANSVRACMDAATLQQASQVQQGIQVLSAVSATWDRLVLSAYTGWGVNATLLTVLPQSALPASITQRCTIVLQPTAASPGAAGGTNSTSGGGSDSSSPSPQTVAIIVGCTVGGTALVAAAALLLWRATRAYAPAQDHDQPPEKQTVAVDFCPTLQPLPGGTCVCRQPDSKLVALLRSQEQRMLGGPSGEQEAAEAPLKPASTAASRLDQAHQQLMSMVAARQSPLQGKASTGLHSAASGESSASSHQQAVQQLAMRLQGNGDGGDTVTLTQVLGRGGGGTVYLGVWRGLPVAVKTMVFEAWEGDEASTPASNKARLPYMRAIMETAISASLGHLHVVATYHHDIKRMDDGTEATDASSEPKEAHQVQIDITPHAPAPSAVHTYKVFLVQELCTCSLRMALQHSALQSEDQATVLSLLHQMACGLQYLHGLGIIHGDLTPANVLLKAGETDSVIVKLADFGLSSRLEAQATHVSNFAAGTPFYVAPEVVTMKQTSPAADIFSFGIIAWELLTRNQPFVQGPDGALKRNPLFPKYPPGLEPSPQVARLISRCLSRRPQDRPAAGEVMAVLEQHIMAIRRAEAALPTVMEVRA